MPQDSYKDYCRAEEQLNALPDKTTDAMAKSIAKFIRKHGTIEVNSTKAGAYILGWKESAAWNSSFEGKDASYAFGIFLKQYLAERPLEWEPAIKVKTPRGTEEKVYKRK